MALNLEFVLNRSKWSRPQHEWANFQCDRRNKPRRPWTFWQPFWRSLLAWRRRWWSTFHLGLLCSKLQTCGCLFRGSKFYRLLLKFFKFEFLIDLLAVSLSFTHKWKLTYLGKFLGILKKLELRHSVKRRWRNARPFFVSECVEYRLLLLGIWSRGKCLLCQLRSLVIHWHGVLWQRRYNLY